MPQFRYKAVDRAGKIFEGFVVEADSQADSLSRLRAKGMAPIQFLGKGGETEGTVGEGLFRKNALDACDFTNRLVPLLSAQIPLERSLGIIEEGMDNPKAKEAVGEIRRGLHEGKRFSQLIRERGRSFPPMYANMVEAGEEAGALNGVMKELQRFLNEGREMREFLITSSIYPGIILVVTIVVSLLLFTVFIPKFSKIFVDLGKEMPLPTRMIMGVSTGITDFWWLWIGIAAAIFFFFLQIRKGGRCREVWDEHVLKVPVFGKLVQTIEIARFVRTLAVLIENHVHLLETIRISDRIIQNSHMQKSLTGIATELKSGARLSKALSKSPFIPNTLVRMLGIGEETGNMGEMLDNVAKQYEELVRQQVKRLLALFEPAVILFLAVVVMAVVLSMFLAILEMNQL